MEARLTQKRIVSSIPRYGGDTAGCQDTRLTQKRIVSQCTAQLHILSSLDKELNSKENCKFVITYPALILGSRAGLTQKRIVSH